MPAQEANRSFASFLKEKPSLKYVFFGGKGGVGKTVVAAAAGYFAAEKLGKKVLISSTNPVHSLSSLFGQDLLGKGVVKIDGASNLFGLEIDIAKTIERYKSEIGERLKQFLKYAELPVGIDSFTDIASMNPAFEESAMFDDMIDVMLRQDFDFFVFDTAPVAHTYRLLGMSRIYALWLQKMIKSREEALSLRVKLSFRREKVMQELKKDPLLGSLMETRRKTEEARKMLVDPDLTAFFFVTLPLALPIAVIERFIGWVRAFDVPVGGVIVNGVLPSAQAESGEVSTYISNKLNEQAAYLQMAQNKFPGLVRAYVPFLESEVGGIKMVERVAEYLGRDRVSPV